MDTALLKVVIDSEPDNAARTDAEVLTWGKETVDVFYDVTWEDFALWAARHDAIDKLETAKSDTDRDIGRAAGTALLGLNAGKGVRLSLLEVRGLLQNLIPAVFSIAERDDLLDFSKRTEANFHGFPDIDDASWLFHIAEARAL